MTTGHVYPCPYCGSVKLAMLAMVEQGQHEMTCEQTGAQYWLILKYGENISRRKHIESRPFMLAVSITPPVDTNEVELSEIQHGNCYDN